MRVQQSRGLVTPHVDREDGVIYISIPIFLSLVPASLKHRRPVYSAVKHWVRCAMGLMSSDFAVISL